MCQEEVTLDLVSILTAIIFPAGDQAPAPACQGEGGGGGGGAEERGGAEEGGKGFRKKVQGAAEGRTKGNFQVLTKGRGEGGGEGEEGGCRGGQGGEEQQHLL